VRCYGLRERYLRAMAVTMPTRRRGGGFERADAFVVFDLRRLARELGPDIPGYLDRDVPGLVKYTLRAKFGDGLELVEAIRDAALAFGRPEPAQ
jgi:hypothetical protein